MALPGTTRPRGLRSLVRGSLAVAACTAVLTPLTPAAAQPTDPGDDAIARVQSQIDSGTATVSGLAGEISRSQESISELEMEIGSLREGVNKALVDLHDAQATAEQARQAVTAARERLNGTQEEIEAAQEVMDEISRSAYRTGAKSGAVTDAAGADSAEDALDRRTFLRVNAEEQRAAIDELDELRTRQANEESQLRAARDLAEQRAAAAADAKTETEEQIRSTNSELAEVTAERDRLVEERDAAQAELDRSRQTSDELHDQRREYRDHLAAEAERKEAETSDAVEEPAAAETGTERVAAEATAGATETGTASAPQDGDPGPKTGSEADRSESRPIPEGTAGPAADEAAGAAAPYATGAADETGREESAQQLRDTAASAVESAAAVIAENTASHTSLDNPYPVGEDAGETQIAAVQNASGDEPTGAENGGTAESGAPEVPMQPLNTYENVSNQARETVGGSRKEQIETVIARAKSQIGVPYAWGGGDATGPTRGIRDGGVADRHGDYRKTGFDCSGLMVYAFAGVGIALPHYTGYQYNYGEKIDPAQMQRGDLIFYGPEAEHHVAIYLGDGKMLEAPQSGSHVQISDVRWSGMSPSAVRLI